MVPGMVCGVDRLGLRSAPGPFVPSSSSNPSPKPGNHDRPLKPRGLDRRRSVAMLELPTPKPMMSRSPQFHIASAWVVPPPEVLLC